MNVTDVLVGFILGLIANYIFEATGLKTRAAKSSKARALRRISKLEGVRDEVRGFQSDRIALNGFLIARLFLVMLLWITQEAIDYMLGLLSNGAYSASLFGLASSSFNPEKFSTSVATSDSAVAALFLVFIINIGYRSYRVWNRVNDDKFVTKVDLEIAELKSSIKS